MSEQSKPRQHRHHKSKQPSQPTVDEPPAQPTVPVTPAFTDFAVKESSDYSQMKNNIITQSTRVCEIVSDASKFGTYYNDLTNNIVSSMNDMIRMYIKTGRRAILVDIFDALVEQTDWNSLKERFKADAASKQPLKIPKYTPISTDLKRFKIDTYDTDVLVDMYSNMDESTVKAFAKSQDEATNNLYALVDDVSAFETNLCSYRTATITTMKANIETLYALHVNYAKAIMNKEAKIPETITLNGKPIKFQKAQKPFITDALKAIILG